MPWTSLEFENYHNCKTSLQVVSFSSKPSHSAWSYTHAFLDNFTTLCLFHSIRVINVFRQSFNMDHIIWSISYGQYDNDRKSQNCDRVLFSVTRFWISRTAYLWFVSAFRNDGILIRLSRGVSPPNMLGLLEMMVFVSE